MKTPLEVIQEGEREFDRRFIQDMRWINKKDFPQPILHHNKTQTLALLQAQIAELEGRLCTKENKDHICRFNDGEQTCECYNQAIQDQIDSIDAVIRIIK